VNACIELTAPSLVLNTKMTTVVTTTKVVLGESALFFSKCKFAKIIKKLTKPKISTKSQPHQPFQFNSCCAHQPPKIKASRESVAKFFPNSNEI
jgi:hypothetical protein